MLLSSLLYVLPLPLLDSFRRWPFFVRAGDVLLHCVVDAILGALGLPDIGQIFPDSDPRWKGADSSVFMREAVSFSSSGTTFQFIVLRQFDFVSASMLDYLCAIRTV